MLENNEMLLLLSGQEIPFAPSNIVITQPRLKDIAVIGEDEFFMAIEVLSNFSRIGDTIRQGNYELENISDFQLLLEMINSDTELRQIIIKFFTLIFPGYLIVFNHLDITFKIEIKDEEQTRTQVVGMIRPFEFEAFGETLRKIFLPQEAQQKEEYNPANDLANAIAEKLKKGRERVQELKNKEDNTGSLFATFASTVSIGTKISIREIMEYTPFQLFDAINRFWAKTENDMYQKVSTTPFMDASQIDAPEEWFRNLYS